MLGGLVQSICLKQDVSHSDWSPRGLLHPWGVNPPRPRVSPGHDAAPNAGTGPPAARRTGAVVGEIALVVRLVGNFTQYCAARDAPLRAATLQRGAEEGA